MNANIYGHFQICIGARLKREDGQVLSEVFYKKSFS